MFSLLFSRSKFAKTVCLYMFSFSLSIWPFSSKKVFRLFHFFLAQAEEFSDVKFLKLSGKSKLYSFDDSNYLTE